jgi:hypothetical protein
MANPITPGERRYNWASSIVIVLKPTELAKIITAPQEEHIIPRKPCEQGRVEGGM